MAKEKTEYNLGVASLWEWSNGSLGSMEVDAKVFDALQQVQIGGRLVVREATSRKTDKSPTHYLEYIEPGKMGKPAAKGSRRPPADADEDTL